MGLEEARAAAELVAEIGPDEGTKRDLEPAVESALAVYENVTRRELGEACLALADEIARPATEAVREAVNGRTTPAGVHTVSRFERVLYAAELCGAISAGAASHRIAPLRAHARAMGVDVNPTPHGGNRAARRAAAKRRP